MTLDETLAVNPSATNLTARSIHYLLPAARTVICVAESVPSALRLAWRDTSAPALSRLRSPMTRFTTGMSGGTRTFTSPSLCLRIISRPLTSFTVTSSTCSTLALVMVAPLSGAEARGRCPSPVPRWSSEKTWTSDAKKLPSACFAAVVPKYMPLVFSEIFIDTSPRTMVLSVTTILTSPAGVATIRSRSLRNPTVPLIAVGGDVCALSAAIFGANRNNPPAISAGPRAKLPIPCFMIQLLFYCEAHGRRILEPKPLPQTTSRAGNLWAASTIFVPKKRSAGHCVTKFLPFVLGTRLAVTRYYYGYQRHSQLLRRRRQLELAGKNLVSRTAQCSQSARARATAQADFRRPEARVVCHDERVGKRSAKGRLIGEHPPSHAILALRFQALARVFFVSRDHAPRHCRVSTDPMPPRR